MGGLVTLLLGERYPNLYSGVLDVCGLKSPKDAHKKLMEALKFSPELMTKQFGLTPEKYKNVFRPLWQNLFNDIESECGGSPEETPEEYERRSPVYNAKISIPVITVHGEKDTNIRIEQSFMYKEAVEKAGSIQFYRLYSVKNGGHCDEPVITEAIHRFFELVSWSHMITPY